MQELTRQAINQKIQPSSLVTESDYLHRPNHLSRRRYRESGSQALSKSEISIRADLLENLELEPGKITTEPFAYIMIW